MAIDINIGSIWTMLTATVLAMVYVFTTFATADDLKTVQEANVREVEEVKLSIWYGQFYDRLDDRDEAVDEGNVELAKEYKRQMEKLRAQICEQDPQWERCDDD